MRRPNVRWCRRPFCKSMPEDWEILGDLPVARSGSLIKPRELVESEPFVIVESGRRLAFASFQQNNLETLLAELIRERTATRSRTDNDDYGIVAGIESSHESVLRQVRGWPMRADQAANSDR